MSDKKKTVIALGYFDSVHKGHRLVIDIARRYANEHGATLTVFTFKGNLKAHIFGKDEKNVYTAKERENLIRELGADQIYFAPVNKSFLSLGKLAFLNHLNKKFDIIAYVSGDDYTFGKKGRGDILYLEKYAKAHVQAHVVASTLLEGDKRVSTTRIKGELSQGRIDVANKLLGKDYFLTGKVFGDRKVGSLMGYPTLNLKLDDSKFQLKNGVYKGYLYHQNKKYIAIINYGARPTFNLNEKLVEAHVLDFDSDLYGREITLYFTDFMREIKKFDCKEKLISQLKRDEKIARGEKV